jgi:hypothetical protein
MNELKTLETRLRSWKPRRPSARLESKLFGRSNVDLGVQALFRWLTPLTACAILTVAALNHPDSTGNRDTVEAARLLSASLSNQHYASYLPGSFKCEANRLDTFGWTNGGHFPSSTFSIPPVDRVNY